LKTFLTPHYDSKNGVNEIDEKARSVYSKSDESGDSSVISFDDDIRSASIHSQAKLDDYGSDYVEDIPDGNENEHGKSIRVRPKTTDFFRCAVKRLTISFFLCLFEVT